MIENNAIKVNPLHLFKKTVIKDVFFLLPLSLLTVLHTSQAV